MTLTHSGMKEVTLFMS